MSPVATLSEPRRAEAFAAKELGLPTPHDRPAADVVIFDGKCGFCREQVRRLSRWDNGQRLAYLSVHDPLTLERYPELTFEQLMDQMYVVDGRGRAHGGADAIRYLTRRLPQLWWAAPVLHAPFMMPAWRWGYRQVAKRRYEISRRMGGGAANCDSGSCELHFKS
ncbi:MAG TPA: DUF393 domain-containing protein [Pirellulaceae bacterium]|nr:DUF393 domain-containing protein [Pirellulaceae bacterium]